MGENRSNLRPLRRGLPPRTPQGGCGRCHPTLKERQNNKNAICTSISQRPPPTPHPRLQKAYLAGAPHGTFLFASEVYLRLVRGITGNLEWHQKRAFGACGSPGTMAEEKKRCPLLLVNKHHLTLGEALASPSPPLSRPAYFGGMRSGSGWWTVAESYLHTGSEHRGFHGCLPILVLFDLPPLQRFYFCPSLV